MLSSISNLCATGLICHRLIRIDSKMRRLFHDGPDSLERFNATPYSKISMVLVESALPFALFGLACAIISQVLAMDQHNPDKVARIVYNIIFPLWVTSCVCRRFARKGRSRMTDLSVGPRTSAHHLSDCRRKLLGFRSNSRSES